MHLDIPCQIVLLRNSRSSSKHSRSIRHFFLSHQNPFIHEKDKANHNQKGGNRKHNQKPPKQNNQPQNQKRRNPNGSSLPMVKHLKRIRPLSTFRRSLPPHKQQLYSSAKSAFCPYASPQYLSLFLPTSWISGPLPGRVCLVLPIPDITSFDNCLPSFAIAWFARVDIPQC